MGWAVAPGTVDHAIMVDHPIMDVNRGDDRGDNHGVNHGDNHGDDRGDNSGGT